MKAKKGMLICFVGIDGSGKTTLAKALVASLAERKISSHYVYNRFQPLISKPLTMIGKSLFLKDKDRFKDYNEYSQATIRLFRNSFLAMSYRYLLLLDYLLQAIIRVSLPLLLGRTLICDRYIYDIATDLAVEMNLPRRKVNGILKRYLLLLPEPDLVFLVDLPEEVAFQRKDDVPSIDYLKKRRGIYLDIGREYSMIIIDGSQSLVELESEVRDKVISCIQR